MATLVVVLASVSLAAFLTILLFARRYDSSKRTLQQRRPALPLTERHEERGARDALEAVGRTRAHQVLVRTRLGDLDRTQTPREDEIGVTRREFFNRALFAVVGLALAGAGSAVLAFLWPSKSQSVGFGGKVTVTGLNKILTQIQQNKAPFYVPAARTWLQRYPQSALPKAKTVYKPVVYEGMQRGVVALYQRCPHLGCRVPWCQSSQWFECPCHGSKYNAVGEKKAGPAPRGMDRFAIAFAGDAITIDTENVVLGPPIGTNTTGQEQEGPLCV